MSIENVYNLLMLQAWSRAKGELKSIHCCSSQDLDLSEEEVFDDDMALEVLIDKFITDVEDIL